MKRCRSCKIPIEGTIAKILKKVVRCSPSTQDPTLCNRCYSKDKSKTYTCQICNRPVDVQSALTHVKAEEYLLDLIKKDHPEWKVDKGTCPQCIAYYRQLIQRAKI